MNFLKNRKGDEKSEFFSIILAVGGILLIGGLGFLLYSSFVNQDLNNAKKFVDSLKSKIEKLDDGENNTFALRGVKDWVLVGYNFNDTNRPDKCFLGNCICVCKDSTLNCEEQGFCRKVDKIVNVTSVIDYPRFTFVYATGTYYDVLRRGYAQCVLMQGRLAPFFIKKTLSDIYVSSTYSFDSGEGESDARKEFAAALELKCSFKEGELLQRVEDGTLKVKAYPYQGGGSPI